MDTSAMPPCHLFSTVRSIVLSLSVYHLVRPISLWMLESSPLFPSLIRVESSNVVSLALKGSPMSSKYGCDIRVFMLHDCGSGRNRPRVREGSWTFFLFW